VVRLLLICLLLLPSLASALPVLPDTALYASRTSGCHDVDLSTWQHPVRAVFEKADIKLEGVQLCNGDHYAIFTAELPYDPTGQTNPYFHPLYRHIRATNGKWPYAIVASSDNIVVYVSYSEHGVVQVDYEQYAMPQEIAKHP